MGCAFIASLHKMSKDGVSGVTTVLPKLELQASIAGESDLDDKTLGALGYKQEFKRYFHTFQAPPARY